MFDVLDDLLRHLPDYLGGHVLLSVSAMAVGLVLSLPLGVLASKRPRLGEIALGVAGIMQTVPSLALLVIMVPLLGAIGFAPAFVAISLYSVLPILANTIAGLRSVDPILLDAGRGLGMTSRQLLWRVQIPIALPIIVAGVRAATVMTVGAATLATPVGGVSLGNYIFSGLETNNMRTAVFGCLCTAVLAVLMDQLVRIEELAAKRRSRKLAMVGAAGLCFVVIGGLLGPISNLFAPPAAVVAGATFTEQAILTEVLKKKLEEVGFRVDRRSGLGHTILLLGLKHNQIDCCVAYTGDMWAIVMKRKDTADRQTTYNEARRFLREQYGIVCQGPLGFENAYALAMRRQVAERMKIRSIADLSPHSSQLRIAGDMGFFHRQDWNSVRTAYKLSFKEIQAMDPSLMYSAVAEGTVDVVCAYTTDGRILENNLVVLADPLQAFPPYDAILLMSARASTDARLTRALTPLLDSIDADQMRRANLCVNVLGKSPRDAALQVLHEGGRK